MQSPDKNIRAQHALQGGAPHADALLECLVFLSSHYGRARSAESIKAGLAYDEKGMGPNLFCEAAQRAGLKTRIVKRPALSQVPASVLPCVIILKNNNACVLLEAKPASAKIFLLGKKG